MTWQLFGWLLFSIFADFREVKKLSSYFADFGQVKKLGSYFADFRQVKNLVVILLTLGKSKT